jgi:putative nucleotidyltransferase with HDIG domain
MPEGRILIVDDEAAVCDVVSSLLSRAGYQTVTAASSQEALHKLREQPPVCDLVIADIMMRGADGLELLDQISLNHPGTPVILCTAVHDVHVATSAFRRGAIDYLIKPFERTQLLRVVERGIEHGRLHSQNQIYRANLEELVHARTARLRATMQELESSYDITLEAMGDALDLRDAETQGHSRRVTAYTIALARQIGVPASQLRVIARGAFLHDIGKISTPDRILLKPGRLDPAETVIMRQHCQRGYEMIRKIPFLREAAEIVFCHQESFDGSGYPRGLKGEQIPLGARIFAIADTLDAVTSDRPYRPGASFETARKEIERVSGTQFDPDIVRVFLSIPVKRWYDLRNETGEMSSSRLSTTLLHPEPSPSQH